MPRVWGLPDVLDVVPRAPDRAVHHKSPQDKRGRRDLTKKLLRTNVSVKYVQLRFQVAISQLSR